MGDSAASALRLARQLRFAHPRPPGGHPGTAGRPSGVALPGHYPAAPTLGGSTPGTGDWRSGAGRPETAQRDRRGRGGGAAGGGRLQRRRSARCPADNRARRGRAEGRDPHGAGADRPLPGGYGRVARTGRHARPGARPAPRAPGPADVDAHRAVQPRGHPAGLALGLRPAGHRIGARGHCWLPWRRTRTRRRARRPAGWPWPPRPWPSCWRASRPPRPATPCCCGRTGRPDDQHHRSRPPSTRVPPPGVRLSRMLPPQGLPPPRCSPRSPR